MVLVIDPQISGLAGNMFIGAFIDLGANSNKITEVINTFASEFGEINIHINKKSKNGIMTTFADIQTTDNSVRHLPEILTKLDEIRLERYPNNDLINKTVKLSKKVFETLANAESHVHGQDINKLHFHEVGCADAVADIVGSCYAYYLLGFDNEKIYSLPVNVGSGSVKTQHGLLPVPAPAVINILKNAPIVGSSANVELATPTGCAILMNIVDEFVETLPMIKSKSVGYGSGKKDLDSLNALRLIKADSVINKGTISVLETNVDNVSGEIMGNLFDKLLSNGARDVAMIPVVMKKNRPGHIIKVICKNNDIDNLVEVLMKETGTLGIRVMPFIHRGVSKRKFKKHNITIDNVIEEVNFKIGYYGDELIKCTPEFEDLKRLSDKTGISIKDLNTIVINDYMNQSNNLKK